MGYRIAREDWQALDPVGVASSAGGPPVYHDGTTMPPWMARPGQSKEAYIVSESLRLMVVPVDQIRKIRPPVPYGIFPPTEGYDTQPLTINDILDVNRWAPQRRSWISGTPTKIRRSDVQQEMFSGTARNISSTSNPML
jgi:hypothetical protein